MSLWITLILIGALTFATRLSFIVLLDRYRMPDWVRRALRLVPIAVLCAIILPALVLRQGSLDLSLNNARLLAGALAVVVAAVTRNALLTIVVGMGTLWILLFALQMYGGVWPWP